MKKIGDTAEALVRSMMEKIAQIPDCTCDGDQEKAQHCPARVYDLAEIERLFARGLNPWEDYSPACRWTQIRIESSRTLYWRRVGAKNLMAVGVPYVDEIRADEVPVAVRKRWKPEKHLFLLGPTGTGKTFACVWAAIEAFAQLRTRLDVRFVGSGEIKGYVASIREYLRPDILILDDMPLESEKQGTLYHEVIDARYRYRKTVYANANISDIAELKTVSPAWQRVISRLQDTKRSVSVFWTGADRRLQK